MADLLARPLVPVASQTDAEATFASLLPRLPDDTTVVACHVIEKAGGAPDKASVEQRKEQAGEIFAVVKSLCADAGVDVETRTHYGTDVAEAVFAAANDVDATAVVFTPRDSSRWVKLLTGDVALDIINTADRPVVVLPDHREAKPDMRDDSTDAWTGTGGGEGE